MLEQLTKAQEKLCDVIVQEYEDILVKLARPKKTAITNWLAVVYGLYEKPVPTRVEITPSPFAALALASELTGTKQTALDNVGIVDVGWVSYYDYAHRIKAGVLSDEEFHDTKALRDFLRCAWDTILCDDVAIVIALPTTIKRDADGNLHNPKGPAIEWADGHPDYAWHGVWVPEKVIRAPRTYTKEEYLAIESTEVRRAVGESAGWDFVVDLLGATETNAWTDPTTGLAYALFTAPQAKFIRKQSPRLQNKKQPFYFEQVHENLKTAQAARKWQAVPTMTPEQCEQDPTLTYGVET